MTLRRCLPIAATLLTLAFSSTPASADQFVAVDVTYTHSAETTKDSHYFVKPSAATPPNWRAPVNYAGGSVYMHFEVFTKPSKEPTVWVVCFIGTPGYACTDSGVYTTTGTYERSHRLPDLWQYDQVDWAQEISQIPLILKDNNNVKIAPENVGAARSSLFMPTTVRMVVTLVSAGGTYVPPSSSDSGVVDGGADDDATDGDDASGDHLDDVTALGVPDRGPSLASTDGGAPVTDPVGRAGAMVDADNQPSETRAPAYGSDSGGCSVGHGRTSALVAFLVLFILALRRRACKNGQSGFVLALTCFALHCGADDPGQLARASDGNAGTRTISTGGQSGNNSSGPGGSSGAGGSPDTAPPEDAATSDATPSEVGATTEAAVSTPDGGPSSTACPDPALVCDDFEDGDLAGWNKLETGGTFAVEGTHAYSGKSSVRLTIPANQRGGFLEQKGAPLFPLMNNTIWGRMMVFYESMAGGHFDTIRGAPAGGGTPWCNIGGQGKALLFNYYSGNHDCWGTPNPKPPITTNKWMCWEWKYDGSKNEMDLWIDGTLTHSVVGVGGGCVSGGNATWAAPTFGSIRLGEFNAQTDGAQTRMWMDDIALGTSGRIGCPMAGAAPH